MLIVDDSSYVRMVLARMLGDARGIEVVGQARDGVEALELARELKPDVITLDVEMPRKSGLDVLAKLIPTNPTSVVMLSSLTHAGAEVTMRALELGAVDFVGKPGSAGVPDLDAVRNQLTVK
jgi:two-component system chemotaxis response regulator CheB